MSEPQADAEGVGPTPFHDLDAYLALPRLAGLALSPDGDRLVTSVAGLDPQGVRYVSALWEVDPAGRRPARRLTRSAKDEKIAAFLPSGDLLFTSARPDPQRPEEAEPPAALWLLPSRGEARVVAARAGGITGVQVARDAGTVVVTSPTLPAAVTGQDDAVRRKARKEAKVSAILHEAYPVRYWDADLGPDAPRLLVLQDDPSAQPSAQPAAEPPVGAPGDPAQAVRGALRDLTPAPGRALDQCSVALSPDGTQLATTWQVPERGGRRVALALLDVATGQRRMLLQDAEHEYSAPSFSPDGRRLALLVERRSSATQPTLVSPAVLDLASGELSVLAPGWDGTPSAPRWSADGSALLLTADFHGRAPVFRVPLDGSVPVRLTGDDGAYSDLVVARDGSALFALRAAVDSPPAPVRLDPARADQQPVRLPSPVPSPALPGRLTEVGATAADGTPLRAWLCLPDGGHAQHPAPLLLWIHGGPLGSWNSWSWRWNPWLAVAQGYAVLLPDPALSTGYGERFIARGWGAWGAAPFTDLMTITDQALEREDLDEDRTAAMGGSFGGYMANWVAGQTDRFRGIVTHASLWALDQFGPTTDAYYYWRREMTPQMALDNSPHLNVDKIVTPMLVIHGDKDYRVPIGDGLRLWAELAERGAEDGTMPHRFLYFPDENHWILSPQHAKLWYATVFAFLRHTVHGEEWQTPDLLR